MIPAVQSALQGMNRNQQSMLNHSVRISRFGTDSSLTEQQNVSLPEKMVGLSVSQRGFEANLIVMKTADKMLGSLIDILA